MKALTDNQLRYWLALWRAPKIGPKQFALLLQDFPETDTLFTQSHTQLKKFNLSADTLLYFKKPNWQHVDKDCAWAEQPNHSILSWQDKLYPPLLKEIGYSPPLLFIQGDPSLLSKPQLAMVGSRSPTPTGQEIAKQFAKELSLAGLVITSGLALGIDGASHQGALIGSGKTIAVMATGMDILYPKEHESLATQITQKGGALVSEYPLGVSVQAKHFPRRNRIVSGLSVGTLVVEASVRSGSLITARLANEQGREIFAIPGSIHNPNARGCHQLIQQGAKLVANVQDIIEELGHWITPPLPSPIETLPPRTDTLPPRRMAGSGNNITGSPNECGMTATWQGNTNSEQDSQSLSVLSCIGYEITTIDELVSRSRLTAADISSILLKLELRGMIKAIPGGYVRQ